MAERDLTAPDLFVNRELSWLEFNDRVLREGGDPDVPLLERLKFLAIVSSNLDEFFMVRVAGLKQKAEAGRRKPDLAGMPPADQLDAIRDRVRCMVADQGEAVAEVLQALRPHGLVVSSVAEAAQPPFQDFLEDYVEAELAPTVTPLAVTEMDPCPILPGLTLYVVLRFAPEPGPDGTPRERAAVIPVPSVLPRFLGLPDKEVVRLVPLEDVLLAHAERFFPGETVVAKSVFRLTRDADVAVEEEDARELLEAMEAAVRARRRRAVVRLEVPDDMDPELLAWLTGWLGADARDVVRVRGLLDVAGLMSVATRPGFDDLKVEEWPPLPPRDLLGEDDLWTALKQRDVLLIHPYESFEPVLQMVDQAADDPEVLAIKQTLYRVSGNSPIIGSLARAAENGKQVTVLVELKARFDEAENVNWARQLEDAGCFVVYGIAGYKTHAKALLVVRREGQRIRRYVHLATGNYNDKTARLYSDIGLMTSDRDLTGDTAAFFNILTGYSEPVGWSRLTVAPTGLRDKVLSLIDREIKASTPDDPGLIMAKLNSLYDRDIGAALYRASRAGVRVRLNVRGICCLRPGVSGVSENLEVVSIVDRFLEHARVFYFRGGGHEEVYLSSADWMVRNLDKRLELMFPVQQEDLKRRLIAFLETCFADNVKARRILSTGESARVVADGPRVRAQQRFYEEAKAAAAAVDRQPSEFRPLTQPEQP